MFFVPCSLPRRLSVRSKRGRRGARGERVGGGRDGARVSDRGCVCDSESDGDSIRDGDSGCARERRLSRISPCAPRSRPAPASRFVKVLAPPAPAGLLNATICARKVMASCVEAELVTPPNEVTSS